MGGVIAVSIANVLERQGRRVAFVGLFDSFLRTGPQADAENPLGGIGLAFGGVMAGAFAALSQSERREIVDRLASLEPQERIRQVVAWGMERNLITSSLSPEMFEQQVALAEIHTRLLGAHTSRIVEAPIHVWWARDKIREGRSRTDWSRYTTGETHTEIAEGNHFTMVRPPHCVALAGRLKERLERSSRLNAESAAASRVVGVLNVDGGGESNDRKANL
jgi:thioesterase domain-containing protein